MIPCDCIYYDNGKGIEYVGLYIGNNTIIHASSVKGIEENVGSRDSVKTIRKFLHQYRKGQFIFQTRTPLKYIDNGYRFLLDDFNGNGIMDLFCMNS